MQAIVTIMQTPIHGPVESKIIASYIFEDAEQAEKVAANFGYKDSVDTSTVLTAEVSYPREAGNITSLHIANSIMFKAGRVQSGSFEQKEWLVSQEEVTKAGDALKAAFDDRESAYANDVDGSIVKLDSSYTGDLVFYAFNPLICRALNRELVFGK